MKKGRKIQRDIKIPSLVFSGVVEQDGRWYRTRSGLCVVINGNLKQRELTISFFICSPRGFVLSLSHLKEEARVHLWHTCRVCVQGALFFLEASRPTYGVGKLAKGGARSKKKEMGKGISLG